MLSQKEEYEVNPLALYKTSTRASASELAAGVVHDINNPLQVMMLHLELLQSGRPMPNWIEMFGQQVERITALTNRLREFAHSTSQEPGQERMDVNEFIAGALAMMQDEFQKAGITVERALRRERLEIQGNPCALRQVFLELFINAREAMPDGGTLQVKTERDGERIVIRVIDSGKGIAKDIEDHLFKPFVTTKGDGRAGVGLAICARTVALHRGDIKVEEGAGSGATFRITLPRHRRIEDAATTDEGGRP